MVEAANLKEADFKMTPKRRVAVLGHMCESAVWMMEWMNHQMQNAPETENDLAEKIEAARDEDLEKGLKILVSLGDWYDGLRRLAKRALCSCVDQPYQDMTDFLLGYSNAFSRKPKTFNVGNIGNPTHECWWDVAEITLDHLRPSPEWEKQMAELQLAKNAETEAKRLLKARKPKPVTVQKSVPKIKPAATKPKPSWSSWLERTSKED